MSNKLYDLMNWPEIEGIVYSECDHPRELLGGQLCRDGYLVQVFRPDAVEVQVKVEGRAKAFPMEKVDEAGFFAALLPYKKKVRYRITMENLKGRKDTYTDPYQFDTQLKKTDLKKFMAGTCVDAYRFLGSHAMTVDSVAGMHFAVWAPNARRVSVVGAFNGWDGRIYQMQKDAESGIFELFIPGLEPEVRYNYEVKLSDGRIRLKADPYGLAAECGRRYTSIADADISFSWTDTDWMAAKKTKDTTAQPVSVCELDLETLRRKDIVDQIAQMGFNYVELMPVCGCMNDRSSYETISYFALQDSFGAPSALQALINQFHHRGIGVLMDWNAAFMGQNEQGLTAFDGTALYETVPARLVAHPDLQVSAFDYAKPEVCSFLLSSMLFWIQQYHVDGFRVDEVASMLYLDYGRNAGEWVPNMYGGNENLAAISLIRRLRTAADKHAPKTLLIAEETSGWPQVTGDIKKEALGFDYKWNDGWKKEFLPFMETDPLFRKGIYGRLTYSMLYQYSEHYMLEFSHEGFGESDNLYLRMPGSAEDEKKIRANKLGNVRTALGYLFTHPGKKLVNYYECAGNAEYIAALNALYTKNPALYELDHYPEGFEWIDNVSAEETVLSFVRRADDGTELLVALNFTPVCRAHFRVGVTRSGKYREIFNSDDKLFGGGTNARKAALLRSEEQAYGGRPVSVELTLPPLGMVVYAYEPYTFVELEKNRILKEAAAAKEKAEKEAAAAQALKEKAEAEARLAIEAAEKAKAAAKAAWEAKLDAEQKAEEAFKTSQKIDEETKQKLAALEAGKE